MPKTTNQGPIIIPKREANTRPLGGGVGFKNLSKYLPGLSAIGSIIIFKIIMEFMQK